MKLIQATLYFECMSSETNCEFPNWNKWIEQWTEQIEHTEMRLGHSKLDSQLWPSPLPFYSSIFTFIRMRFAIYEWIYVCVSVSHMPLIKCTQLPRLCPCLSLSLPRYANWFYNFHFEHTQQTCTVEWERDILNKIERRKAWKGTEWKASKHTQKG